MNTQTDDHRDQTPQIPQVEDKTRGCVLAICDLCPARDYAPLKELRESGWFINRRECFCPRCEGKE